MKCFFRKMGVIILIASSPLVIQGCGVMADLGSAMEASDEYWGNYRKDKQSSGSGSTNPYSSGSGNACITGGTYETKVYRAQKFLQKDGLYKGPIDCVSGGGTDRAMTAWLKDHGYKGSEGLDFFLEKRSKS